MYDESLVVVNRRQHGVSFRRPFPSVGLRGRTSKTRARTALREGAGATARRSLDTRRDVATAWPRSPTSSVSGSCAARRRYRARGSRSGTTISADQETCRIALSTAEATTSLWSLAPKQEHADRTERRSSSAASTRSVSSKYGLHRGLLPRPGAGASSRATPATGRRSATRRRAACSGGWTPVCRSIRHRRATSRAGAR